MGGRSFVEFTTYERCFCTTSMRRTVLISHVCARLGNIRFAGCEMARLCPSEFLFAVVFGTEVACCRRVVRNL